MDRAQLIQESLNKGMTLKEIGRLLGGVSRQRVYQLMDRYNIQTPEIKRHGYWKEQSSELKWLQRTMTSRGISKENRALIREKFKNAFPTHCPVLGVPLVYGSNGLRGEDSASLDRTDSSKGYEPDNVEIICWRANRIKNNGTLQDFVKIVAHLSK